jgi:hypothetical protein
MNPLPRQALMIGFIVVAIWFYETMRPVPQPPGILAPDPPQVTQLTDSPRTLVRSEHVYTPLAKFQAKARILSIERYGGDRESRAALLDVALGWGRLSDSVVIKNIDVAQTERRVLSKSYDPALSDADLEAHILNLHLVTADSEVETRIKQLRSGNVVRLEGYLVEAAGADNWRWKGQPRARDPELPGTLLWVERLELEAPQAATKS